MSLEEMKQKAMELILKLDDKEKMKEVLLLLSKTKKEFTVEDVFERTSSKYATTLQKLAN